MIFKKDTSIQLIAEAYALDAINTAKENFNIDLDNTEASIEKVETILDKLHRTLKQENPSEEMILDFTKMFGSYGGEVYRKYHPGEWGIITFNGEEGVGIHDNATNCSIWPWSRVYKRIINGSEDNVWHYYRVLTKRNS